MTKTERVIRLLTVGLKKTELKNNSRKYRKFTGRDSEHFYFVGKSAAVRSGKNASNSISITSLFHSNMRLWERKNNL